MSWWLHNASHSLSGTVHMAKITRKTTQFGYRCRINFPFANVYSSVFHLHIKINRLSITSAPLINSHANIDAILFFAAVLYLFYSVYLLLEWSSRRNRRKGREKNRCMENKTWRMREKRNQPNQSCDCIFTPNTILSNRPCRQRWMAAAEKKTKIFCIVSMILCRFCPMNGIYYYDNENDAHSTPLEP